MKIEKPLTNKVCELVIEARSISTGHNSLTKISQIFKCSECEVNSKTRNDLLIHIKSHNIYACDKCDYKGIYLNGLNGHTKTHN